jgi:hypothetical protein
MAFTVNEVIVAMVDSIMISNVVFTKSEAVIIMPKSILKTRMAKQGYQGEV